MRPLTLVVAKSSYDHLLRLQVNIYSLISNVTGTGWVRLTGARSRRFGRAEGANEALFVDKRTSRGSAVATKQYSAMELRLPRGLLAVIEGSGCPQG